MDELTDAELITRVLKGETALYRPLVVRYQSRLFAMVRGMVRDDDDAKDIVQMAFVKAYQSLSSFRIDSSFYTWIYRIAMNLAIDHTRKNKRRKTTSFEEAVASRDEDGTLSEQHMDDNPARELQRKQLRERIYGALDELTEDMREVVLLREVEGLSYKEIADVMGIPEGTVMSRLFYARKKLQARLGASSDA
ncbi:MAG: sigma-70 family RNA polymerase sigma factor [Deltaproteobacteria bacterium]|nr:sigma-70 family RNA polymerase sigma factor [Deltaproteobacteria bacterium]